MDENLNKAKKILQALDDALAAGPWNENSFIIMLNKKLRVIRDDLAAKIALYEAGETDSPEYIAHRSQLSVSHKLVYVSLYSLEGINIVAWEKIIANLPRQIVSRPVYANEEDALNIIKSKEKKINEAYAAIYVSEADILQLSPDKVPMDKLGKPIMVLKDNAIHLENIEYFYHMTGKYRYLHGRLVKME